MERRLSAILAADVVGYSRLMSVDEPGTLARLKEHREQVVEPEISAQGGRIVKFMGDGILAEFSSVVEALNCAVSIQQGMADRTCDEPEEERFLFRIGIHIGDVIIEGEDLYGDGVNVAARLEALADPGGICVSGSVNEQVEGKVSIRLIDNGERSLKNIKRKVRVYKTDLGSEAPSSVGRASWLGSRPYAKIALACAFLVVAVGSVAVWMESQKPGAGLATILDVPPVITDQPSIAVLPFDNLSDDPDQEWFADGMTTDLITDLSQISGLFVIARNTSFVYKDRSVDATAVGRELGVKYLLEGSIRRSGDAFRINATLLDASTGGHLWAERYDEQLSNVFALQDKVTRQVVEALAVELTPSEDQRIGRAETTSEAAYEAFLRGREHFLRHTPEDFATALGYFLQAVELDPDYGRANAALAQVYYRAFELGWTRSLGVGWNVARLRAGKYLQQARSNPTSLAYRVTSEIYLRAARTEEALEQAEIALELEPNDPENMIAAARAMIYLGMAGDALELIDKATRADLHHPAQYLYVKGLAYFTLEHFEEAVALFQEVVGRNPDIHRSHALLAASYAYLGESELALESFEHYRELETQRSHKGRMADQVIWLRWPYKNIDDWKRLAQGLVEASGQELPVAHLTDTDLFFEYMLNNGASTQ